jgi:poly(3-hydroxybutyrate) depolymerase
MKIETACLHSSSPVSALAPFIAHWLWPMGYRRSVRILSRCGLVLAFMIVLVAAAFAQAASTVQFAASSYTVAESAGTVSLAVQRSNDTDTEVSVDYATADGSATNGLKYISTSGSLVFAAGETNQTIVVPILNEGLVEGTRTFAVTLSDPTNAVLGARATATVSIVDVDVGMQFQFLNYNAASGWPLAEDAGTVLIGVVRGDDADIPVTVDIGTSDVTATSGVDYIGFAYNLSFAPTERLKFVPVTILNDSVKEVANKTFRVTLSNPVGVSLGTTKTTTVTIMDNDQGFAFESANYYVAEDAGVALIGVLRGTDDTNSTVTVSLATADNSATSGLDYTGLTNTLSFAPGERRKVVPVPILNDGIKEGLENFTLILSNPTGGAVLGAPTTTTVYIRDNDPGVGFEAASYTNAWGQAADFAVTVLRGNDTALGPITVDYATSDLTAANGLDYQGGSGTLTFLENETVKNLPIPILRGRSGKTFRVTLSNPTPGVTLGTATTTVSIKGDYAKMAPPFDTRLTIRQEWGVNVLNWAGGGQLQRADKLTGPWQTLTTATNPWTVQSPVPTTFYRVTRPRPVGLYVPPGYDGQTNMPLVILLHAYTINGGLQEDYMKFRPLAEKRGFLYCYPDGMLDHSGNRFWNATDACCDFWSTGVDDAGYIRGLIEEIGRQFAVDRKHIHLIGHSVGGWLAYRMACESAALIASLASFNGMTSLEPTFCHPSEPVNILHIHGTADTHVPYYGGALVTTFVDIQFPIQFPSNLAPFPGAVKTIETWATYNGASGPITGTTPSMDLDLAVPGLDTMVTRYTSFPPGGAVELWTINGGSHVPTLYSGTASSEFASRVINWLLAHPKP